MILKYKYAIKHLVRIRNTLLQYHNTFICQLHFLSKISAPPLTLRQEVRAGRRGIVVKESVCFPFSASSNHLCGKGKEVVGLLSKTSLVFIDCMKRIRK